MNVGPHAGKIVQVAHPTGRHRVDFRNFCDRVAKSTTFNRQEVQAVLNYATEIAKDIVSNGDIVEFGDLGTLNPSFKSKAHRKARCPSVALAQVLYTYRCELRTNNRQAQERQEAKHGRWRKRRKRTSVNSI